MVDISLAGGFSDDSDENIANGVEETEGVEHITRVCIEVAQDEDACGDPAVETVDGLLQITEFPSLACLWNVSSNVNNERPAGAESRRTAY